MFRVTDLLLASLVTRGYKDRMHNNDTITVHTRNNSHTISADRAPRVLDLLSAARERSGLTFRVDDRAEERVDNAERDAMARLKAALDAFGVPSRDSTYRNDAGPSLSSRKATDDGTAVWQCWCVYDHDTSVVVDNVLIRCGRVVYNLVICGVDDRVTTDPDAIAEAIETM